MPSLIEPPAFQSSGELPVISPERASDIDRKHRRVAQFLKENRCSALLLQRPCNLAWLTSGADFTRQGSSETTASLFLMPDARVVLTNNIDSAQIFEGTLAGLGFQLKERPWHEAHSVLVEDLCRGRVVASDTGVGQTKDVSEKLLNLRLPLNALESERLRELGLQVAHAVEATARNFEQGVSEAELAGQLSHRLLKHQVVPERLQICGDGIAQRFRHWTPSSDPVERICTLTVIGRREGLHAAVSRTVCFGEIPDDLRTAYRIALMTQATGMFFSQAGWAMSETWKRVARIFEKFGHTEEWEHADQAEVIGYQPCEVRATPNNDFILLPGMAMFWHPSVGPVSLGDTMLIGPNGLEVLTPTEQWPMTKVDVKGTAILRPDILQRTV
ncbi:MAG: M24 family metallopeptidase [Planctomycetaceae bacterium]